MRPEVSGGGLATLSRPAVQAVGALVLPGCTGSTAQMLWQHGPWRQIVGGKQTVRLVSRYNGLHQLIQRRCHQLEQRNQIGVKRCQATQRAAIPAVGLNQGERFQALNQAAGSKLYALLAHLPLEHCVGEQSHHIDEKHGRNPLVLVEVEGRDG